MKFSTVFSGIVKLGVAAAFGFWAYGAFAQIVEVPGATPQRCKQVSELANASMEARQLGVSMSQLMKHELNDAAERINNKLISDAYAIPRATTVTGVRRAIEDFENEAYRSCYAQIKPGSIGANAPGAESNAYDFRKYCQSIGQISGGSSQIEAACVKMEKQAQENLRTVVRSAKAEKYCTDLGTTAGGSYRIKEACIKQENAAAATLQ